MGVVKVTWPIFNVDALNHISVVAEVRVAKFYVQVEYIVLDLPANGRG